MSENGPIYGVELIGSLPLDSGMRQALPSRRDLLFVRKISERTVAGYEVLLEHYRRSQDAIARQEDEIERLHNLFGKRFHLDVACGSCGGPLDVERDAICCRCTDADLTKCRCSELIRDDMTVQSELHHVDCPMAGMEKR